MLRGYSGIVEKLIKADGKGQISLTQCCSVAGLGYGRDGSYEYYLKEPVVDNDLKGVGPFILSGIELQRLLGLPMAVPASASKQAAALPPAAKSSVAPEWAMVPEILARIQAPVFPAREFPITDFGAAADGGADCTEAIRKAIEACVKAGGGRVVVPAGEFLTGPIHLKSNVELHLDSGATLKFKTDPRAYLPAVFTRFEGMECYNYSPLIYAYGQENVAVTGEGAAGRPGRRRQLVARGREKKRRQSPNQKAARRAAGEDGGGERAGGASAGLARADYLAPELHRAVPLPQRAHRGRAHPPLADVGDAPDPCTNVIVRGVDIVSHGPNNDGCNPECCRDVLIEDCVFDTGDDCIAIKSGRNNDGRRLGVPSENIIIRRCTMKDGHGGVIIGSEISGGCRNVFVEDCRMDSPEPRPRAALQIQRRARRGDREHLHAQRDGRAGGRRRAAD